MSRNEARRMSRLDQHDRVGLAIRLIRRDFRTPIVQVQTGLSLPILRDLYKEIHNRAPASGKLPEPEGVISTRQDVVEASFLMNTYAKLTGQRGYRVLMIEELLHAYDLYEEFRDEAGYKGKPRIDHTQAWLLARCMRSYTLDLRPCRCGLRYVVVENQRLHPNCPICNCANEPEDLRLRRGLRPAEAPLALGKGESGFPRPTISAGGSRLSFLGSPS